MEFSTRHRSALSQAVLVFVCFWLVFLATASDATWHNDGIVRYYVAGNLLHYGDPILREAESGDLASAWAVVGRDNHLYSFYGLGHSLAMIPLYAAADAIDRYGGIPYIWDIHRFMLSMLAPVLAALLGMTVFAGARALSYSTRTSFATAAAISLATVIWPHSRDLHDNLLEALLITASLSLLLASQHGRHTYRTFAAGAAFGLAVVTRTSAVLALPGLLIVLYGTHKGSGQQTRRLFATASAFAGGAATTGWIWFAYNYVRFGNLLDTGYGQMFARALPLPGQPIWPAVAAWLVGLSNGLLIYVPALLLVPLASRGFVKRSPFVLAGGVLTLVQYLIFYSSFRHLGYWSYGPNYLLPTIAWLLLSTAALFDNWRSQRLVIRALVIAILAASFLVQLPGVVIPTARTQLTIDPASEEERWTSWRYAPLRVQSIAGVQVIQNVLEGKTFSLYPEGSSRELTRTFYSFNVPDWWWMFIIYRGFKPAAIVPILLLIGAGVAAVSALSQSEPSTRSSYVHLKAQQVAGQPQEQEVA